MPIHRQCCCGAFIRLPDSAAGRRARCRSCGEIFTVPAARIAEAPLSASSAHTASRHQTAAEPDEWLLNDLARSEIDSHPPWDLHCGPSEDQRPHVPPSSDVEDHATGSPFASFAAAVAWSFLFFLHPGNIVTLLVLALTPMIAGFVPIFGWALALLATLYVYAFCMATISETAGGEDELPNVAVRDVIDDFLRPLIQFAGCLLYVLLPAIACAVFFRHSLGYIHWGPIIALAMVGLLFWPAVTLAVAIGGGFSGLWPHVAVRTALSAPLAYGVVCIAVLIAFSLTTLPEAPFLSGFIARVAGASPWGFEIALSLLNTYALIVAMRVIGLFYRHYKHRFPWTAE